MDIKSTLPFLNKYEYTEAIARRAKEISDGSPTTVKGAGMSPIEIAKHEFYCKKSPIKIVRTFPNGQQEVWNINEMEYLLK